MMSKSQFCNHSLLLKYLSALVLVSTAYSIRVSINVRPVLTDVKSKDNDVGVMLWT